MTCPVLEELKTWILFAGVLGGFATFTVGLWQYTKAQRWKVLEFVANEIKEFESEQAISSCMLMLDYEGMEVDLSGGGEGNSCLRAVQVGESELIASLIVRQSRGFTNEELAVRTAF